MKGNGLAAIPLSKISSLHQHLCVPRLSKWLKNNTSDHSWEETCPVPQNNVRAAARRQDKGKKRGRRKTKFMEEKKNQSVVRKGWGGSKV